MHLICGEVNCSELSTYLKIGTTALVLAMADKGVNFGTKNRSLSSPVAAISAYSLNSECNKRAMCDDGSRRSAIDIQRRYLRLAEKHLDAAFMPDWAGDVCIKWREVLDNLEANPEAMIGSLDWPTKLALFKQYFQGHSALSWNSLPVWTSVATRVSKALVSTDEAWPRVKSRQVKAFMSTRGAIARLLKNLTSMLDEHGLNWDELDGFHELRDQLCELDLRYGQLFPRGIFLDLEKAGEIKSRNLEPSQIEDAMERAPLEGRARVRGDWIRRLAGGGDRYFADWTRISSKSHYVDLGDPFVTEAELQVGRQRRYGDGLSEELSLDIPAFLADRSRRRVAGE